MTPDLLTCVESISAERLALWRDGGLSAAEAQRMREHTADCPACRERLAGFERVAETLRTQRELEPNGRVWLGVRQGMDRPPRKRLPALSGRALRGLAGLAAVLVLATLFANLLGSRTNMRTLIGQSTQTATAATKGTPGPTDTPATTTFPGKLEVVNGPLAFDLTYAYVLDNDVWIVWKGKAPWQATHLGLGTDHLIWTVAWAPDQSRLLVNETADVDATSARAWLIQLVPTFAVSELPAASPLVRGCANYFSCVWVGNRFVVHLDRSTPDYPTLYGPAHAYRIYDTRAAADIASPLDGRTIYTMEVRGALIYYSVPGAEFDFGRINIVDPTGAQTQATMVAPSVSWTGYSLWDLSANGMRVITWPLHQAGGTAACASPSCVYYYGGTGGQATNIFTHTFSQSRATGSVFIAPDGSHAAALGPGPTLQIVRQPLPSGTEDASAVPVGSSGSEDELIGWSADSQWVFDRQVALDSRTGNNVSTSVYAAAATGTAPATLVLTLHAGANLFFAPSD